MKRSIWLCLVCLLAAASVGCGGKEVEVDLGSPKTAEQEQMLKSLMESERQLQGGRMELMQQGNAGTAPPAAPAQ